MTSSRQREEFGLPIALADQPDLEDIPGFYRRGSGDFWVALVGGQAVGTIALLDIGNAQGALRKMLVKAAFRGPERGVAGLTGARTFVISSPTRMRINAFVCPMDVLDLIRWLTGDRIGERISAHRRPSKSCHCSAGRQDQSQDDPECKSVRVPESM